MKTDQTIRGLAKGTTYQITRTVTDIPDGQTLSNAWLTIKRRTLDADADAKVSKSITEDSTLDIGIITNPSPPDGTAVIEFNIAASDWDAMNAGTLYFYGIKVKTSSDVVDIVETGTIILQPEIISATTD